MHRTWPRICCLLILAIGSSGCGASASSKQNIVSTETFTLTKFVLPPENTATDNSPSPVASPEATGNSTPSLAPEVSAIPTVTPTLAATKPTSPAVTGSAPRCNDASFVADMTIPDGTILNPGKDFKKTWKLKNTGTCRWTTAYALGFAYGSTMGGTETKLRSAVDPGSTIDVSIGMTAPKDIGWYAGWWRLKSDLGNYFGDFVFVSIQVSESQ